MRQNRLDIISAVEPLLEWEHDENPARAAGSCDISSIDESNLEIFFNESTASDSIFQKLSIVAEFEDSRSREYILETQSNELRIKNFASNPDSFPDWLVEFDNTASFYKDEKNHSGISSTVVDLQNENPVSLTLNCDISKENIQSLILDECVSNHTSDIKIQWWSSDEALKNWVNSNPIPDIVNRLFPTHKAPIFVFNRIEAESDGSIPMVEFANLTESLELFTSKTDDYLQKVRDTEDYQTATGDPVVVSPAVFDDPTSISTFDNLIVYSILSVISNEIRISDGHVIAHIESNKNKITLNTNQTDLANGFELEELLEFYEVFIERGEREAYRNIWHRAIVEHCSSFGDIPKKSEEIIHYYRNLEEDAIDSNFEQLADVIQDAQIFIGDLNTSFSNSTIRLSSEVQKIILAFFSIVIANAFLILRDSSLDNAITFSTLFIAGILAFYLPTAQSRVNEVEKIIDQGKKDSEVYSDIIRGVGAGEFVNLDEFKERREGYAKIAEKRVKKTNKQLRWTYRSLVLLWTIFSISSIVYHPVQSLHAGAAYVSLLPILYLWRKEDKEKYTKPLSIRSSEIPILHTTLIIWIIIVSGYFLFLGLGSNYEFSICVVEYFSLYQ